MRKLILGFGLLLATVSLSLPALAQRGGPPRGGGGGGRAQYLGEANVDGGIDHDNISVNGRGMYRAIQLRVENGPIQFQRVIVHFGNGNSQPIQIRNRIPAGGQTRIIDLPGARRNLDSVEIFYSRGKWGPRRPKVRLFGYQ